VCGHLLPQGKVRGWNSWNDGFRRYGEKFGGERHRADKLVRGKKRLGREKKGGGGREPERT